MKSDYSIAAHFITRIVKFLDDIHGEEFSIYYKPNSITRKLSANILREWGQSAGKIQGQYKSPQEAEKVGAVLKALAELIDS